MPESDPLETLETQIAQLLSVLDGLAAKHEQLEKSHQNLKIECARLQKKNAVASDQIDSIIKQLKAQSKAATTATSTVEPSA